MLVGLEGLAAAAASQASIKVRGEVGGHTSPRFAKEQCVMSSGVVACAKCSRRGVIEAGDDQ